jgi:hypothetical protein
MFRRIAQLQFQQVRFFPGNRHVEGLRLQLGDFLGLAEILPYLKLLCLPPGRGGPRAVCPEVVTCRVLSCCACHLHAVRTGVFDAAVCVTVRRCALVCGERVLETLRPRNPCVNQVVARRLLPAQGMVGIIQVHETLLLLRPVSSRYTASGGIACSTHDAGQLITTRTFCRG